MSWSLHRPSPTCVYAVAPGPLPGPRAQIHFRPGEKSATFNVKAPIPNEGVENEARNGRTEAIDHDAGAT